MKCGREESDWARKLSLEAERRGEQRPCGWKEHGLRAGWLPVEGAQERPERERHAEVEVGPCSAGQPPGRNTGH